MRYLFVLTSVSVIGLVAACGSSSPSPETSTDAGNGGDGGPGSDSSSPVDSSAADGGADSADAAIPCPADGCVLATDMAAIRIAVDGAYVYWASTAGVQRVPVLGGASSTIAPLGAGETFGQGITVHAGTVFWTTGATTLTKGTVSRVLVDGGSLRDLATDQDGLSIVADDTSVFWEDLAGVKKEAADGGAPLTVAPGGGDGQIVLNGGFVYWGNTQIMKLSATGGAPVPLTAAILVGETQIAADATNVYFINSGTVSKVVVGGGTPVTLASPGSSSDSAIAVDATYVYYTTHAGVSENDGTIAKVPVGGGAPIPIASNLSTPFDLAVDGNNIYWIGKDGKIRRLPK